MSSTAGTAPHRAHRSRLFSQAFRFGLVGIGGAIVDYSRLQLIIALGVWPELARLLSFTIGSAAVYLVNRRWTFTSRRDAREVGALASVLAVTFALVGGVNVLALMVLPDSGWRITLAWVLSQAIATTFNFLAQRMFVFRNERTS